MEKLFNKKITERLKDKKGITLIALIITIIILIILTAVTINNVIGTDLIGFATKAVENYTDAARDEADKIDKLAGALENQGVGEDSAVRAGEIVAKTEKDNYTDADGRKATIPAGFKVSTKPNEQYIKNGLVIQDEEENEFVWVPCYYGEQKPEGTADDVQEYKSHVYAGTANKTYDKDLGSIIDSGEGGWKTYWYTAFGNNWKDDAASSYGNTSVTKYGGFYVARYEAGWEDTETSKLSTTSNNYVESWTNETGKKNISTGKRPISKANVFAWNFINHENALSVSETMYPENSSVDSKLIDGTAWDTITSWIANDVDVTNSTSYGNYHDNDSDYTGWYAEHVSAEEGVGLTVRGLLHAKHFTNGSIRLHWVNLNENGLWDTKKNNYTDSNLYDTTENFLDTRIEIPTGSFDEFKLKNIYDLAGNMWEWTTEVGDHKEDNSATTIKGSFAVLRGGSFWDNGSVDPICLRCGDESSSVNMNVHVGFRVVLYIK